MNDYLSSRRRRRWTCRTSSAPSRPSRLHRQAWAEARTKPPRRPPWATQRRRRRRQSRKTTTRSTPTFSFRSRTATSAPAWLPLAARSHEAPDNQREQVDSLVVDCARSDTRCKVHSARFQSRPPSRLCPDMHFQRDSVITSFTAFYRHCRALTNSSKYLQLPKTGIANLTGRN